MLITPLEQFQIISIFTFKLFCLDFSFTNLFLISLISFFGFSFVVTALLAKDNTFHIIPNTWQVLIETVYEVISQLLFDNINQKGEKYLPFISVLFSFILLANLIGLIPYSFTLTSHLIVTFSLSTAVFIGVNIIGFNIHSTKMLSPKLFQLLLDMMLGLYSLVLVCTLCLQSVRCRLIYCVP